MPGFGSGLFGSAPFGSDPPSSGPDYQRQPPPAAVYFDPLTRDFLLATDGRYRDMGTVEQQVTLAFSIPRGTLLHKPDAGHDFLDLPRIHGEALDAEIDRRAKLASPFDRLLADGLVVLEGVNKRHPKDTETNLEIRWRKVGESTVRTTPVGTR